MPKDALGHGSNSRGGSYQNIDKNLRGPGKHVGYADGPWHINKVGSGYGAQKQGGPGYIVGKSLGDISNRLAAEALSSGTSKSDAAPVHDSMMHSDRNYAGMGPAPAHWSPEDQASYNGKMRQSLDNFKQTYGGPRDLKAEAKGFAAGKREINRLKKQGK